MRDDRGLERIVAEIEKRDAIADALAESRSRAMGIKDTVNIGVYVEVVLQFLGSKPKTAQKLVKELAEVGIIEVDGETITCKKIAALLHDPIADGAVVKTRVRVKGKIGRVTAYALASA